MTTRRARGISLHHRREPMAMQASRTRGFHPSPLRNSGNARGEGGSAEQGTHLATKAYGPRSQTCGVWAWYCALMGEPSVVA